MESPLDAEKVATELKESTKEVHGEKTESYEEVSPAESTSDSASVAEEDDQLEIPLLETPSISMSAGADPWADPSPVAAMASAISVSKRPTRDNPWATNTPDLVTESSTMPLGEAVATRLEESQSRGVHSSDDNASHHDDRWGELHLPKLGNTLARYWSLKPGLLQLNNGSYGACPKPVCDAYKALQDRQEENIDLFRHTYLFDMLAVSRGKVAKILNCQTENVVLVANASLGTNSVLRDLVFKDNDAILYFSFTYGALINNVDYLVDTEKIRGNILHKIQVKLTLPWTKKSMLQALCTAIQEAKDQGKRIVIGVIDTISSKPAVRMPWEEMVKILREHQILSLVDGAHGIGHIPIDLTAADPDYFISNCHKWLYAHRGCAVLYVSPRIVQRSSLPTSWDYVSNPTKEKNNWIQQWASTGTVDVSPFLSVDAAIDFRQMLGGEERIMSYNIFLAHKGGLAAAQILDTCILEPSDAELKCGMVNVQIPIIRSKVGNDANAWMAAANSWLFTTLQQEFKTTVNFFAFQDKIWARLSAQVWLEVADFEYGARALLELSKRVNEGSAPDFLPKMVVS